MPGSERIDSIIDLSSVGSEIKQLNDWLDASVANMQKLSDVMKNYKGATGFQEQKVAASQLSEAFGKNISMQKEFDAILQRVQQRVSQYNGSSKEITQQIVLEAKAQKELAQAINIRDKATQSAQKSLLNEKKIANDVSNDYKQLSLAYNEAALKAKNYILTLGANHPITVQAVADANAMGNKLKEIDASVGQYQRNVGNYNGAIGVLGKSLRGFGGIGLILSKALGIDPTIAEGVRETGKAFIDLKHAEDIEKITKAENAAQAKVNTATTNINTEAQAVNNRVMYESALSSEANVASITKKTVTTVASTQAESINTESVEANTLAVAENAKVQAQEAVTTTVATEANSINTKSVDLNTIAVEENAAAAEVNSTATQKAGVFQRIYTGIVGESTGAMKIFKLALAGIGVGLAIFGIVELIKYISSLKNELSDAARYQKELNTVNEKAIEGYAAQKIEIENLVARVKDENTSNNEKKQILKEVNDKYGDQFGKLKSVSDLETTFVNKAGDFIKALELKAKAQAAFNLAVEQEQKALKDQLEIDQKNTQIDQGKSNVPSFFPEAFQRQGKRVTEIAVKNLKKDKDDAEKAKDDYLKIFDDLNKQLSRINTKNDFGVKPDVKVSDVPDRIKKAAFETNQAILQDQIKSDQDIYNDQKKSQEERLAALRDYVQNKARLIELERTYEKSQKGLLKEEVVEIETKKQLELNQVVSDATKEYNKIVGDAGAFELQTRKTFSDAVIKLIEQGEKDKQKALEDGYKKELSDRKKANDDYKAELGKLEKELGDTLKDLAFSLVDDGFTKKKNEIQEIEDMQQASYDAEVERINSSTLADQEKANKLKILEAQRQAQKETNDRKQRQIDQDKAKFDKAASIANIIEQTSIAIIKTLAEFPGPHGIALAVLEGAIGAAQLAKVIATPIPKYEKGGKIGSDQIALTDEKGPELYIGPDGNMFFGNNQPTIRYLQRGTEVVPHDEVVKMMEAGLLNQNFSAPRTDITAIEVKRMRQEMRDIMIWHAAEVRKVYNNKKQFNINLTGDYKNSDHIRKAVYE